MLLVKIHCENMLARTIHTIVSRYYYDTAGIRKMYLNIQTIELSTINF